MDFTPHQRSALLDVARTAILAALERSVSSNGAPDDPALHQPAGCFVSLHAVSTRALRGCVGRLDSSMSLHAAVSKAARDVLFDPRFDGDPVTRLELPYLELEISVLSPLQLIDHPLNFELEHGIYICHERRGGCFLPQVARQTGWSKEQLLDRLCSEKLGIDSGAWRDAQVKAYTFMTCVIGPEPFERGVVA